MYFEGDPLIRLCPIVNAIPQREAIESLIGWDNSIVSVAAAGSLGQTA